MFWSCDDDSTEGMTRITYYAQMTLNGDDVVYVNLGDSYNEEGCVALINGQDVSENIEISSNVNPACFSADIWWSVAIWFSV